MTPTEDYLRQIEYWKEAARQAEDEATFLRGQYNEAEEKRSKAEAKVARLEGLILDWRDAPAGEAGIAAYENLTLEARRIRAQREEGPLCDGSCGLKRSDQHRHGFGAQREEGRG